MTVLIAESVLFKSVANFKTFEKTLKKNIDRSLFTKVNERQCFLEILQNFTITIISSWINLTMPYWKEGPEKPG